MIETSWKLLKVRARKRNRRWQAILLWLCLDAAYAEISVDRSLDLNCFDHNSSKSTNFQLADYMYHNLQLNENSLLVKAN